MSEFKESHSVSKLIGAAPGYVGYESQTLLIDKIRTHPHSVIILDEIEKAHKDVVNVFFNIFDEGYFYDAKKRKIDFTNSIIIMTSNIGSDINDKNIGFLPDSKGHKELLKVINNHFSFEFINRIDEIICFKNIDKDSAFKIATNYLKEFKSKFDFEMNEDNFMEDIIKEEELKKYGARYIKRELKKKIIKVLENKIEVY